MNDSASYSSPENARYTSQDSGFRSWLCLLFLIASTLVISGPLASKVVAQDENNAAELNQTEQESATPTWTQQIDEAFGTYLVGPLENVIFFDFYTGPRKNTDGEVTRQGWLKTTANPNGISIPFVVVWLFLGAIFLTIRMGFINLRAPRHAIELIRGKYDNPDEPGEVSHFQALAAALSATVGLGNIAGVAIAIGTGGPGACFWIIIVGLLGMTSKFAECSLGQIYRTQDSSGQCDWRTDALPASRVGGHGHGRTWQSSGCRLFGPVRWCQFRRRQRFPSGTISVRDSARRSVHQ